MNLREYIITMIIATLLCWFAWFFVLFNVDPFETTALGFVFFYVSFFLSLIGTCSLIIFLIYYFFSRQNLPLFKYVRLAFKQAFIASSLVVLFLFLQGKQILNIWNIILLLGFFILLISFMFSMRTKESTIKPE